MRKSLCSVLALVVLLIPAMRATAAAPSPKQEPSIDEIKLKVTRLGVGKKARATITKKDGAKVKGYVYSAGDDDFVMRDRDTDAPTIVRYGDVAKVHRDGGHSTAKHLGLGIGIGVGAFLGVILIVFASLND